MQGRVTKKIHVANIYNETPIYLENVKTWANAENAQVGKEHIKKVRHSMTSGRTNAFREAYLAISEQFMGDRFTEEYTKWKRLNPRRGGYPDYRDWSRPAPHLPPRYTKAKPAVSVGPSSPPAVRKVVGGMTKFVPSGMESDDEEVDGSLASDSEDDGMKPKAGEISATFKPYDGGSERLSTGGGLTSSFTPDMKSKTTFTGMRESGSRPSRIVDSDADSDDDLPSKRANEEEADDGQAKPDTLAFTNDAISLEQVSKPANRLN